MCFCFLGKVGGLNEFKQYGRQSTGYFSTYQNVFQYKREPHPPHLVIHSFNVGNIHVMGGGTNIFVLLSREDVNTNQVNLREYKTHKCIN